MRIHVCVFAAILAATAVAQNPDPLASAKARLHKALANTATQTSGSFAAKWGPLPDPKAQQNQANVMILMGGVGSGNHTPGAATGSWAPGLLHVTFADQSEVLFGGCRMLAKDSDIDWCLRRDVLLDGSPLPFVPDVPTLLQQLAGEELTVVHQEVGTRDDRPVEILTVTLTPEQVTAAMWGGTVPKPAAGMGGFAVRAMMAAGAGAPKPVIPKPDAILDLAVVIDPAAAVVHSITVRSHQKNDMPGGGRMVVVAQGGGAQVVNGGDDEEEDEDADAKLKAAPLQFKDGLPQRPRKQMVVWDYSLELKDLGTAKAPELSAATKALLGIQ